MKYVLNIVQDVESVMIEEVLKYFNEEVRFHELYPMFGNIRISGTHPFAYLIDQQINNTVLPTGIFPSITIVNDTDQKTPELDIMTPLTDVTVTAAEIQDIIQNRDKYAVSTKDLNELRTLTENDALLNAQGVQTFRTANIVVEIWSENPIVKNKIYDLVIGFLIGIKRFTIKDDYGIVINEGTISGEKSGNYNFDFGKIIYGGILRFTTDFPISNYTIDTDREIVSSVAHIAENINPL